jgi:hypothetical protein
MQCLQDGGWTLRSSGHSVGHRQFGWVRSLKHARIDSANVGDLQTEIIFRTKFKPLRFLKPKNSRGNKILYMLIRSSATLGSRVHRTHVESSLFQTTYKMKAVILNLTYHSLLDMRSVQRAFSYHLYIEQMAAWSSALLGFSMLSELHYLRFSLGEGVESDTYQQVSTHK